MARREMYPRFRCPLCGWLAYYSMLEKAPYKFEILGFYNEGFARPRYQPIRNRATRKEYREYLRKKIRLIAEELGMVILEEEEFEEEALEEEPEEEFEEELEEEPEFEEELEEPEEEFGESEAEVLSEADVVKPFYEAEASVSLVSEAPTEFLDLSGTPVESPKPKRRWRRREIRRLRRE